MGTRKNMPERRLARQQRAAKRFKVMPRDHTKQTEAEYAAYVARVSLANANLLANIQRA